MWGGIFDMETTMVIVETVYEACLFLFAGIFALYLVAVFTD